MTENKLGQKARTYRETTKRVNELLRLLRSDELDPHELVEAYDEASQLVNEVQLALQAARLQVRQIEARYDANRTGEADVPTSP